jgi:recombination protein RecR
MQGGNSSKLLAEAVEEFSKLPGIGNKTALRLVLHLLKQDEKAVENFSNAIIKMKQETGFCKICNNLSDSEICSICSNLKRDASIICVVEGINDVMAIEQTQQYKGLYHVLGGVISPIDGIGPSQLKINDLIERIGNNNITEIIFALPTTMEGETTAFYIYKKLEDYSCSVSSIAKGIAIGDELQYADEITLGQSILNRRPFNESKAGYKR